VRVGVRVGRVTSEKLRQKPQISKSKRAKGVRRKTARRSADFKSDSWYAGVALSISIKARPKSHRARAEHPASLMGCVRITEESSQRLDGEM
jgi:hypothetical protein